MSSLNSQSDLLRAIILKDEKPSSKLVAEAGVDIEILEGVVARLKPTMDYLRGYLPLENWFTPKGDAFSYEGAPYAPHPAWLKESGLAGEYPHCIEVFGRTMRNDTSRGWFPLVSSERDRYDGESDVYGRDTYMRHVYLRVWLTRRGKWIVWVNYPTSVFQIATDPASALKLIQDMTPRDLSLAFGSYSSPALEMLSRLTVFFRESVELKKRDAVNEEQLLEEIVKQRRRFS